MDLSTLEHLIPLIAAWFGITPSTLVFYIGLLVMGAKLVSRLIPDDAPGALGVIHKIAQFIAFDASNRITKGVSQADIAKQVVGQHIEREAEEQIQDLAKQGEALIPEVMREPVKEVIDDFTAEGLARAFRESQLDSRPGK